MRAVFPTLIVLTTVGLFGRGTTGCATSEDSPDVDDASTTDGASPHDGDIARDSGGAETAGDAGVACSPDGWCYTDLPRAAIAEAEGLDPGHVRIDLRDIWVTSEHDVWAVAEQGYVLHWENDAWSFVVNAKAALRTVWAAGANDLWIAGNGGVVFHGTEKAGALAFDKVELGTTDDVIRLRGSSASEVLAITANEIFRSTGGAFSAIPFPNAIAEPAAEQIWTMWGSGTNIWIGAREHTDCSIFDPDCTREEHTVLLRWDGIDANSIASFDRIELELFCNPENISIVHCVIQAGALAPDGSHFLDVAPNFIVNPMENRPYIAHVAARDAGILDAGAVQGDGGYVWTIDDTLSVRCNGFSRPPVEGIFASAGNDVSWVASPGMVRHWDGHSWTLSRIAVPGGPPLFKPLHGIAGVGSGSGRVVWIVGENVAMMRRVGSP